MSPLSFIGTPSTATLVATTNTELLAAAAFARTVYLSATTAIWFRIGAAAGTDGFILPLNQSVLISLPAGAALNVYAAGTPVVSAQEVKQSG